MDDYTAGPIMCSASTIYRSIKESGLRHGQWALFPGGGGGVGLQGVQISAALGMRPIVVDTGEEKRKLCLELGAEAFIDFKQEKDVATKVVAIADGIGAHGVFVTAPAAYASAVACVGTRVGASIMAVGLRKSLIDPHPCHAHHFYDACPQHDRQILYSVLCTLQSGGPC